MGTDQELKKVEFSRGCVAKLDRIQIVSESQGRNGPPKVEGFRTIRDSFVGQQTNIRTYLRCRESVNDDSGLQIRWQYAPQHRFLYASKVTFIGDDRKGVSPHDLQPALNHSQDYGLLLTEIAFDFEPNTGVTKQFIRRHAIFGKSQPRPDRGGGAQLRYGGRHSDKLVRVYEKPAVGGLRVELELHARLMRSVNIRKLKDVPRAVDTILPKHFQLVAIRWDLIREYLVNRFQAAGIRVLKRAKSKAASIHSALLYLRSKQVNNVHRFLEPMKENQLVLEAANKWALGFAGGTL